MSIFANLNTENIETQQDSVGGFSMLDSNIYTATIKAAYVTMSQKGAMAVNMIFDIAGREYREQLWVTNANGENYYKSKQTGHKIALPGFTIVNDICICTTGKELREMDAETKTFKIYDPATKQEAPKEVPAIMELVGTRVLLGILKSVVNKRAKNDDGEYVPTNETREENHIDKVFHEETHKTVNEARAGAKEAAFYDKWLAKNMGQTINRAKTVEAGTAANAPTAKKPTKSLFG